MQNDSTRRSFLKKTTAAAAGAALTSTIARTAHAQGSDTIRFGVIGCGGRGSGAAQNIMETKGNTKLVGVADVHPDIAAGKLTSLARKYKNKVDVTPEDIQGGLDGYKRVIDSDCEGLVNVPGCLEGTPRLKVPWATAHASRWNCRYSKSFPTKPKRRSNLAAARHKTPSTAVNWAVRPSAASF